MLGYKLYIENNNFQINDGDEPDVKAAKDNLNDLKGKISDYNSKKSNLESKYKAEVAPTEDDIKKIIGEGENKNQFLLNYSNILSKERKIRDLNLKRDKVKLEISEYSDRLSTAEDENKVNISNKIKELNINNSEIGKNIIEEDKKLKEMRSKFKDKMKKSEIDIKEWINKL